MSNNKTSLRLKFEGIGTKKGLIEALEEAIEVVKEQHEISILAGEENCNFEIDLKKE